MACAASTEHPTAFFAERAYRLGDGVLIRREAFGALAYDFKTRRLTMIGSLAVAHVVETLGSYPSAKAAALAAAGPGEAYRRLIAALEQLYRREVLHAC
jgi:putative mycofactocin binding protein MftB